MARPASCTGTAVYSTEGELDQPGSGSRLKRDGRHSRWGSSPPPSSKTRVVPSAQSDDSRLLSSFFVFGAFFLGDKMKLSKDEREKLSRIITAGLKAVKETACSGPSESFDYEVLAEWLLREIKNSETLGRVGT